MADLKDAEATRDGQAQASADLDRFYASVLPVDMPTARRMTHLKLSQLARSHDVIFQGGAASTEVAAGFDPGAAEGELLADRGLG